MIHEVAGPAQTEALAAELAGRLGPGDVVLLTGDLGAGKTTFVRGACRALGVREPVTSPTFTIGQRYEGETPVAHVDLYRLGSLAEEEPGLLDDYLDPGTIAFVEWPDAARAELQGVGIEITIEHDGGDRRRITIAE